MENETIQADVFAAGADGVNTYRIPSLVTGPGGVLLAFCEARKESCGDASPTDLVLKRSTDGGASWGEKITVLAGAGSEAIMNPCPVVAGETVLLACLNAHRDGKGRHRQLLLRSEDAGLTWSGPADLAGEIAGGDETFVPGPGVGILTKAGRLVIPGYTNLYNAERVREDSRSRALLSDDGGHSWRLGAPVGYGMTNESQAVELADGSLVINCRVQKSFPDHPGCRVVAVSRDGGETWSEPFLAHELNESPCQAGFIRFAGADGRPRLVFSNPDSSPGTGSTAERRTRMTVRVSFDEGRSWPVKRLVHAGPTAYSCPAALPGDRLALLYECGEQWRHEKIRLAILPLSRLEPGAGPESF